MELRSTRCPKCGETLARQVYSETLSVWRCRGCHGLVLGTDELEQVREAVRADQFFDTGHPKVGRALDAVPANACPACGGAMERRNHPRQRHVHVDACEVCGAVFLDAGELLDLSHESFLERVWEAVTGALVRR